MIQKRGLEGVWPTLGRLSGGSWAALGRLLAPRLFWAASWAALGQFLRRLGRALGGSGAVLGTKLGRLGGSWRQLGGVLVGFSHQSGTKLVSKSIKLWISCSIA